MATGDGDGDGIAGGTVIVGDAGAVAGDAATVGGAETVGCAATGVGTAVGRATVGVGETGTAVATTVVGWSVPGVGPEAHAEAVISRASPRVRRAHRTPQAGALLDGGRLPFEGRP
jgi:hypothetical protein